MSNPNIILKNALEKIKDSVEFDLKDLKDFGQEIQRITIIEIFKDIRRISNTNFDDDEISELEARWLEKN